MFRPSGLPLALSLWMAVATVPAVQAATGDTLARIRETRSITIGVRESSRPFSFVNENKQSVGYSVDLCLAAVDELKKELKLPELQVKYQVVSGSDRIPKLISGDIDMECGSTTNTKARQEKVAFSYTFFVASMRVLASKDLSIQSVKDLSGLPVALSKGTTSEKLFNQLASSEVKMKLQPYANNAEAYKALKDGKVRAFAQDDSLLLGMTSADKAHDSLGVSPMALSVEPYAIMMRKDDAALMAVVDRSLAKLYSTGEIKNLYRKWFETDQLTVRMSTLTRDSFMRPNKEAGVAMLLGYSL